MTRSSPFTHPDLAPIIFTYCPRGTLANLLGTSKQVYQNVVGVLYKEIPVDMDDDINALNGVDYEPEPGSPLVNLKRQALRHVRAIDLRTGGIYHFSKSVNWQRNLYRNPFGDILSGGAKDPGGEGSKGGKEGGIFPSLKVVRIDHYSAVELNIWNGELLQACRPTTLVVRYTKEQSRDYAWLSDGFHVDNLPSIPSVTRIVHMLEPHLSNWSDNYQPSGYSVFPDYQEPQWAGHDHGQVFYLAGRSRMAEPDRNPYTNVWHLSVAYAFIKMLAMRIPETVIVGVDMVDTMSEEAIAALATRVEGFYLAFDQQTDHFEGSDSEWVRERREILLTSPRYKSIEEYVKGGMQSLDVSEEEMEGWVAKGIV